jgi:hypothetical protein
VTSDVPTTYEDQGGSSLVSPDWTLIAWTAVGLVAVVVVLVAGAVTAAKGHRRILLWGLLLTGLPWLHGARLPAQPGSRWARRRARR